MNKKGIGMDFGIGIASASDSWKAAQRAEELGFTHAWFYDTQMITADRFVAMAAAAVKTSKIRLGTGVLVPSNRIAAVTANAFATLNGLAAGDLYATAWMCGCILQPGEPADSPRAMAQAGPRAATLLHRAADVDQQGWDNTMKVAEEGIAEAVAGYVEMARGFEPPDARYLFNHRGHFVFVKPEERRFVIAELIRRTTFTATEQELRQRVAALRDAGWSQLVTPISPGQESAIDDWARIRDAFA